MKKPHCGCCAAADWNKYKARAKVAPPSAGKGTHRGRNGPLRRAAGRVSRKYSAGSLASCR